MSRRPSAALLDRDGTINEKAPEGDYVKSPDEVRMLPGTESAIARLNAAGVPVFVVSNQRGIALGRMTEADLAAVNERIASELTREGARVDGWYHCPHDHDECDCRKPRPGMLEQAAREHGVELGEAVVIGDSDTDVEAGRRVGARTVRLARAERAGDADHVAASLADAVEWILGP